MIKLKHFQRIFTYIGGITLSEYLRRRRMSLAAVDLKNESVRVIDIAQKYGYDSPTAFNLAFQAVHGISPTQARESGVRLKAFPPLVFQMIVKGTQEMNYRIEKRDAIRILGKKIALKPTLEENFQITPAFWQQSAMDGTIESLADMMDTALFDLMGVSTCNAPEIELYFNSDPDDAKFEIWLPIVRQGEKKVYG